MPEASIHSARKCLKESSDAGYEKGFHKGAHYANRAQVFATLALVEAQLEANKAAQETNKLLTRIARACEVHWGMVTDDEG